MLTSSYKSTVKSLAKTLCMKKIMQRFILWSRLRQMGCHYCLFFFYFCRNCSGVCALHFYSFQHVYHLTDQSRSNRIQLHVEGDTMMWLKHSQDWLCTFFTDKPSKKLLNYLPFYYPPLVLLSTSLHDLTFASSNIPHSTSHTQMIVPVLPFPPLQCMAITFLLSAAMNSRAFLQKFTISLEENRQRIIYHMTLLVSSLTVM